MITFPVATTDTATDKGKAVLEISKKAYGAVPNLHGVMASSPALLESYQELNRIFMKSSLTMTERNVAWLTVSFENECTYCVAGHSAVAKMSGMSAGDVEALRTGAPLADRKLQTLRQFTASMVQSRGRPAPAELEAMDAVGYTAETVLDVVLAIGMKVLCNYTNHLANTPLDKSMAPYVWQPTRSP